MSKFRTNIFLIQNFMHDSNRYRDAPRVKNPGGQVVMRRAAAARRRLLICQNLGGQLPPLPLPLLHPCNVIPFRIFRGPLFQKPVTGQELFLVFLTGTGSTFINIIDAKQQLLHCVEEFFHTPIRFGNSELSFWNCRAPVFEQNMTISV